MNKFEIEGEFLLHFVLQNLQFIASLLSPLPQRKMDELKTRRKSEAGISSKFFVSHAKAV